MTMIGPHPIARYFTVRQSATEHRTWLISMGGVPLAKAYEQSWIAPHCRPFHCFCPPWRVYLDNSFMRAAHGTEDNQMKCKTLNDLYVWLLDNGCMDYVRGEQRAKEFLDNHRRTVPPMVLEEGVHMRLPSEIIDNPVLTPEDRLRMYQAYDWLPKVDDMQEDHHSCSLCGCPNECDCCHRS